jgi:hypothetical protein
MLTVPATADGPYETVVPTLADSNGAGIHRAVFLVRAATSTPGIFYDSAPDSGYSVDNLPPVVPAGLQRVYAAGITHLSWHPNADSDLSCYRIYRGSSANFVPGPGSLIATRSDTTYADAAWRGYYYKLSAVDVNGNESGCALLPPAPTDSDPGRTPPIARLEQNSPNPFNPTTAIAFEVPARGEVLLEIVDVRGRWIRKLVSAVLPPGQYRAVWDGLDESRAPVSSGTYVYRLTVGGSTLSRKLVLVR